MALIVTCAGFSDQFVYGQDLDVENQSTEVVQDEQLKANKDTLEKAQTAIANKDYQTAIVYLTGYISSKPKKYEAYKLRADAFYALRQYKLAEMDYQAAIDLKKDDDKFRTGAKVVSAVVLGVDKQEQYQNPELGNLYAGLMYAQKALNLPAYEVAYQNAVKYNSHIYLPQPKNEDIQKINFPQKYGKPLDPQGADKYIYGAIDDIEAGNFIEGSYKAQYLITNYPKYYLGYYLLGLSMDCLCNENDAIQAYENALKLNPYDFESMASLGQIYYNDAEKTFSVDAAKKSVEYFSKAIKYNPNSNLYYYYIGLNDLRAGDYDAAVSNFNMAVKINPNDFNSSYYKLISLYMKGEYNSVVEGCTNLLYRHVSNSNSVLYLRALANNKLKNVAFAIADIETAQNNMGDIYNVDVKSLSAKENTLDSYLYYLKAQILSNKGFGVKTDLAKAYQNPVIVALSKGGNLENSTLKLSYQDIENQYDYIRTTFDNLNVSFEYLNPDYRFISLKSQKLENIAQDVQKPILSLQQVTNSEDIVSSENQVSMAQMLATRALQTHSSQNSIAMPELSTEKAQEVSQVVEDKEEEEVIVLDSETILFKAPVQKETESFNIKYEKIEPKPIVVNEQIVENELAQNIQDNLPTTVKTVAEEIKETPNFKITYENKVEEPEVAAQENSDVEIKQDTPVEISQETQSDKTIVSQAGHVLNVKQTNLNLNGFGIAGKNVPEIKEDDEVIVFVPEQKSFIQEIDQNVSSEAENLIAQTTITDDFSSLKNNEKIETVQNVQNPELVLIEPEEVIVPEELLAQADAVPVTETVEIEQGQQVNESQPIVDEQPVLIEEDTILEQEVNKKKSKKHKEKKEVALKDFLSDEPLDIETVREKSAKAKKHKDLKEFLSEAEEVTQDPEKEVKKEMELKDFLVDDSAVKAKKEKHSIFKRKNKKEVVDIETYVEEVVQVADEVPIFDEISSEIPQETIVEEPVQLQPKQKKAKFRFFKRNKKTKILNEEQVEETTESKSCENEVLDEVQELPVNTVSEPEERAYDYGDVQEKVDEILQDEVQQDAKPKKKAGKKSKTKHDEE